MNKILLLALLGFTLIALTAGSEDEMDKSLSNPEQSEVRTVREADPKKKNKGKKAKNKGAKKKKTKKNKRSRKNRKSGNKKAKKQKKNKKGGKKGGKKGKRKNRKSKKVQKKERKSKKKKSSRKSSAKGQRQSSCGDDACLANAVKYLKQVKDKVTNYIKQKKRIEKFLKLSTNKGGKNGDFKGVVSQLKESGGGNASALECQGSSTSPGAKNLQELVAKLEACKTSINTSCTAAPPAYNKTEAAACETSLNAFATAVEACQKKSGAEACTCWKDEALATQSASLKDCDLASKSSDVAKFKSACTKAFAECRSTSGSASDLFSACSPSNSPDALLAKLKAATANEASLKKLKDTATAKASRKRSTRSFRGATCAVFITDIASISKMATESPDSSSLSGKADSVVANAPDACTAAEKASLKEAIISIEAAIEALVSFITAQQSIYESLTGSTASSGAINAATTAGAETTASVTTKAPTVTTKAASQRARIVNF